jgi:hypothetical protein
MSPQLNSDDFSDLEARLRGRAGEEPPPDLRDRVLRAVVAHLNAPSSPPRQGFAWYLSAVAALVLLGMNLSLIAASVTRFGNQPTISAGRIDGDIQSLRALVPELSAEDADRLAVLDGPGLFLPLVSNLQPAGLPAADAAVKHFEEGAIQ